MSSREFGHGPLNFQMMSPVIKTLIVANAALFILAQMVRGEFISIFGLIPAKVVGDLWVWQPFTYLFLHATFLHLLFNLFALWMFGMAVESQWGPREFLKYYLICGVGAGLCSVAVDPGSLSPIIGASGAIYGLLVAFAMLYPDAVVYLYFFFPIKAKHMAILFGVIEFFAGAADTRPVVARFAHLGGMIIGYLYIRWWWIVKLRVQAFMGDLTPAAGARLKTRRQRPVRKETGLGDEAAEVDRILDKILAMGEDSLTDSERETLRRQAKPRKPNGHGGE